MRYFVEIAYKGTAYHGWQIQKNAISVQGLINVALGKIIGKVVETVGSGRTDTGVHAEQQFFHMDLDTHLSPETIKFKVNNMLPGDIGIKKVIPVKHNQHARFDAIERKYQYRIARVKDPFIENLCYYYNGSLNVEEMNRAADLLLNHSNFQCFSKVKTDVDHFECKITQAEWKEINNLLIFFVSANRFLRGMVRAIVGSLLDIGSGRNSVVDFQKILESRERKMAGMSVPASGLFLTQVHYPQYFFQN